MAIGKKLRFEVFKADDFTCRYCGRVPPNVVLEVDHIIPKAHDGADDISNLITSCFDCNRGKGKEIIDDITVRPDLYEMREKIKEQEDQIAAYNEVLYERSKRLQSEYEDIESEWARLFQWIV